MPLIWLVPGMRPNDPADIRRGLQYALPAATLGLVPGPTEAAFGAGTAAGIWSGRTAVAFGIGGYLAGVGLAFHLGVRSSNIEQSRGREHTVQTARVAGPLGTRKSMRGPSAQKKTTRRSRRLDRRRRKYCRKHKRYDFCQFYTKR